jgi:hypothetical protein
MRSLVRRSPTGACQCWRDLASPRNPRSSRLATSASSSRLALTATAASRLTVHTRGLGAGVLRTAAQLGGALGIGIIAVVITARTSAAGGSTAGAGALVSGLQAGLWCGAAFTAAALVLVLTSPRSHPDHAASRPH